MSNPASVIALLVAAGLFFVGLATLRVRRRRLLAATRSGIGACACLGLAGLGVALALNLYTYQRLTYEQPVAHLRFSAHGDRNFRVAVRRGDGEMRRFTLRGDQWQLDARVLKWQPLANLLGFDALFRLDRISGRYGDIDAANRNPPSAYALNAAEPGLDAWSLARRLPRWSGFVDSDYGSATYMPMADDAEYDVILTQSGLIARPANASARAATRRW